MRYFLLKVLGFVLIGFIPISILTIGYFYNDPFKVVRKYNSYSNLYVIPNRDYVSTEMFLKNEKYYSYNSFIFGSSRTLAFQPNKWKTFLSPNSNPFMFDASGESVYGIYTKLKFLDSLHYKLNNVLIIICRDVSFANSKNHNGHLFIKHPATSGESDLSFKFDFFKAYLNPAFLFNFYMYKLSGSYKSYMKGYIEDRKIIMDSITNAVQIVDQEHEIQVSSKKYYEKRKAIFYTRKNETIDSIQQIKQIHIFMLNEIRRILNKNNTKYKVIISPLYEQEKFNPIDQNILLNIFKNNLYDFSGKNYFTDSINNYYETWHFRPLVGDSIMNLIYKK